MKFVRASFILLEENLGQLTIEVEDSGIGITENEQSINFEAFQQQSG